MVTVATYGQLIVTIYTSDLDNRHIMKGPYKFDVMPQL
jgi:hypothetical protein